MAEPIGSHYIGYAAFPPKYGRVTRHAVAVDMSSMAVCGAPVASLASGEARKPWNYHFLPEDACGNCKRIAFAQYREAMEVA